VGGESIRPPAVKVQTGSPVAASSACIVWASIAARNTFPPETTTLLSLPPRSICHCRFNSVGTEHLVAPLRAASWR